MDKIVDHMTGLQSAMYFMSPAPLGQLGEPAGHHRAQVLHPGRHATVLVPPPALRVQPDGSGGFGAASSAAGALVFVVVVDLLHPHHLHARLGALRGEDDVLGGVRQPEPHRRLLRRQRLDPRQELER